MNTAFIFDLDGTLVITEKYHVKAFALALADYGIKYTHKEHLEKYSGRGNQAILEEVLKTNNKRGSLLREISLKKKSAYEKIVIRHKIPVVKGAFAFISKAKTTGIKVCVATSTTKENAAYALRTTGLAKFFELVVTRDDVATPKPSPEIFFVAARRLGVKPSRAVVFEDSTRGVEAAERGGFACVGLSTLIESKQLVSAGADLVANNYNDLEFDKVLSLKNLGGS